MRLSGLSEPQRRSVFACLRVLEDRLDQMEAWLRRAGQTRPGSQWVDDIGAERRQNLLDLVGQAREQVDAAFDELGHPPEAISVFHRCQASLGLNWEDSLDLRGTRLRNYGPVSEDLGEDLDTLAERLAGVFQHMRQAMGDLQHP